MRITDDDAASRLGWGIRTYWPWLVLAFVLTTLLALSGPGNTLLSSERRYEGSALVVATQLQIKPEQLPRAADAIFNGGTVAQRVTEQLDEPIVASDLIPDHVRLEPLTDTIVLRVIGRNEDPKVAAELANLTAGAFVEELNKIGEGVGIFKVQDLARPPTRLPARTRALVPGLVGALGGVGLGLGLLTLFLLVRRPLLTVAEAAAHAGTSSGALVDLPAKLPRTGLAPETVGGLALVGRLLWPDDVGVGAVVGVRRAYDLRVQVVRLLALAYARRTNVYLIAPGSERVDDLAASLTSQPNVRVLRDWFVNRIETSGPPPEMGADGIVLMSLSALDFDVPQLLPRSGRVVLFVPEGTPARAVEAATQQLPPDLIVGVVLVRRRRAIPKLSRASRRASTVQRRPQTAQEPNTPTYVHGDERAGQVPARVGGNGGSGAGRGEGDSSEVGSNGDSGHSRAAQTEQRSAR